MTDRPEDLRQNDRFLLDPPVRGTMGGTDISIFNIGVRGAQAEHAEAFKLGSSGRMQFFVPAYAETIELRGRVVWSRLSRTPNEKGKYLYRSGFRFDETTPFPPPALGHLARTGLARLDAHSLQRKEEAESRKQKQRLAQGIRAAPKGPPIPPDQMLLIHHALDQLRGNAEEAQKWYQRARFSPPVLDKEKLAYREDVVAVWEYLGRTIDIEIVARVFEDKRVSD